MPYNTSNPPLKVSMGPLAEGPNTTENADGNPSLWVYASADAIATVQAAGYITNGIDLGMKVGDIVFVRDTNLNRLYPSFVVSTALVGAAVAGHGTATINSGTTLTAA